MTVVDASIVVRLLQNRPDDDELRGRSGRERVLSAPGLIDAEIVSAVRGLLLTSKPTVRITPSRSDQMLDAFASLPLERFPLQPFRRRVLGLRHHFTAYDGCYVALAEWLAVPLLTDDRKYERAAGHDAQVETWP